MSFASMNYFENKKVKIDVVGFRREFLVTALNVLYLERQFKSPSLL